MYRVVFCALPTGDSMEWAQQQINHWADKHNAPEFEPHVTFFTSIYHSHDDAIRHFESVADHLTMPFELSLSGVGVTDIFTKSLFLTFQNDGGIKQLYDHAVHADETASEYELEPHLSLIYSNMSRDLLWNMADELEVPDAGWHFDRIRAIHTPDQVLLASHVDEWEILGEHRFG